MPIQTKRKYLYLLCLLLTLCSKVSSASTQDQNLDDSYDKPAQNCVKKFFKLLYKHPEESESKETHQYVQDFYENSLCISNLAESHPKVVRSFAEFFKSFYIFPVDDALVKQQISEIRKYLLAQHFKLDDSHKDSSSQEHEEEEPEQVDNIQEDSGSLDVKDYEEEKSQKPNKITQGQGRRLLGCLAYHFNISFSFELPKEIKEPVKLKNYNLRWNSACIVLLSKNFKPLLNSVCKVLKNEFEYSRPIINRIAKNFAPEIDFGISVNISRNVTDLFVEVYKQEPKDPEIKTTRTELAGVKVIIHEPLRKTSRLLPGLVFFHGGGWVYRSAEMYVPQTHYLAKNLGAVVVSVDYRRTPEVSYPVPVEDCLKVTQYLMKHAKRFNVDSQRIGVIGDSAGAIMSTSISLMLRDRNLQMPKTQVLIYPGLQALNLNLPSYLQNKKAYGLTRKETPYYYLAYMNKSLSYSQAMLDGRHVCEDLKNSVYGSYLDLNAIPKEYRKGYVAPSSKCDLLIANSLKDSLINPYIFPLMAKSLEKLPPAMIIVNKFDIIRDDGFLYKAQLQKAGVPVKLSHVKRGFHGTIDFLYYAKIGKEVMDSIVKYLKNEVKL